VRFATAPLPAPSCISRAAPPGPTNTIPTSFVKVWVKPFIVTSAVPAVSHPGRPATVIFDGYGVAIPMSGIAMGAVFENVTIPVQEVGVGRLGWLLRFGAPVPASATTPAMTKKNKQRIRRNRGGGNVPFVFVVIQLPVPLVRLVVNGSKIRS